jgi:hypothetical protein
LKAQETKAFFNVFLSLYIYTKLNSLFICHHKESQWKVSQNESEESSYENAAKKVFVTTFEEKCVIPNFLETVDDDGSLSCPRGAGVVFEVRNMRCV